MRRPSAAWEHIASSGIYTDNTDFINSNTDFTFLSNANNVFYIGLESRFQGIYCDLTTNGSYTGLAYYYYQGTTWKLLPLLDSYTFNSSKYQRWNMPNDWIKEDFTNTFPHTATPPDFGERYWLKITTTTVTTAAVINKIRCLPYATYTTPTKVAQFLQIKNDFTSDTRPTDLTVEDMIRRAEDRIDYYTRKSWKFNVATDETYDPVLVDYNRFGVFLRHKNFLKVYSVKLWNGGSWDTLTEGREHDYFANYRLGMILLTRLYILPAVYGMTGRYMQYAVGEWKYSLKVDYAYGRNIEVDQEVYIVEDLATKMVARDLITTADYGTLVVSGSDKISLESKARLWTEQIEGQIDELRSVSIA